MDFIRELMEKENELEEGKKETEENIEDAEAEECKFPEEPKNEEEGTKEEEEDAYRPWSLKTKCLLALMLLIIFLASFAVGVASK